METIHKYPLQLTDRQELFLPARNRPLSVQVQHGQICIWAHVDTAAPPGGLAVAIVGTGNPMCLPAHFQYLGTVQLDTFVWHVYTAAT